MRLPPPTVIGLIRTALPLAGTAGSSRSAAVPKFDVMKERESKASSSVAVTVEPRPPPVVPVIVPEAKLAGIVSVTFPSPPAVNVPASVTVDVLFSWGLSVARFTLSWPVTQSQMASRS